MTHPGTIACSWALRGHWETNLPKHLDQEVFFFRHPSEWHMSTLGERWRAVGSQESDDSAWRRFSFTDSRRVIRCMKCGENKLTEDYYNITNHWCRECRDAAVTLLRHTTNCKKLTVRKTPCRKPEEG